MKTGLNAPYGTPCFLTNASSLKPEELRILGLNAPYGAPYFLTNFPVFTNGKFNAES